MAAWSTLTLLAGLIAFNASAVPELAGAVLAELDAGDAASGPVS